MLPVCFHAGNATHQQAFCYCHDDIPSHKVLLQKVQNIWTLQSMMIYHSTKLKRKVQASSEDIGQSFVEDLNPYCDCNYTNSKLVSQNVTLG